jgi:hypothetical protein
VIRRDYIERLIEQCGELIRQALRLRRAGELDPALRVLRNAEDQIIGPLRPVLERLEATSAVEVAGPFERERVRMYAALIGEEALVYRELGNVASAQLCCRRSAELYAALSLAGERFEPGDLNRIAVLLKTVNAAELNTRYRVELQRLTGRRRH